MVVAAAAHGISITSMVFGLCLLFCSTLVILEYRDKYFKCHGYHENFYANHHNYSTPCNRDDIVFGSGGLLVLAGFIQCIGAIAVWFNYWKVWAVFQIVLLLTSLEALLLPFVTQGLEGFGGTEDIKILTLAGFAGIEFLFALLSLFVLSYLQFQ